MFLRFQGIALDVSYGFRKYSPMFLIVVFLVKKRVRNIDYLSDQSVCQFVCKKLISALYSFSDQQPIYIFGPTTFFGPTTLRTNEPSNRRSTSEKGPLLIGICTSWIDFWSQVFPKRWSTSSNLQRNVDPPPSLSCLCRNVPMSPFLLWSSNQDWSYSSVIIPKFSNFV